MYEAAQEIYKDWLATYTPSFSPYSSSSVSPGHITTGRTGVEGPMRNSRACKTEEMTVTAGLNVSMIKALRSPN